MCAADNIAFADLQGFFIGNDKRFILKEFCFSISSSINNNNNIKFNPSISHHYIFAAPFPFHHLSESCQKSVIWLTRNHHGLQWSQGQTNYNKIRECIQPLLEEHHHHHHHHLVIYVKGDQKVNWLKELCSNISIDCRNIEEIGCCSRLPQDYGHIFYNCNQHDKRSTNRRCALQNTKIIENWYHSNIHSYEQ